MAAPDFWNDQAAARATIDKKNALEAVTEPYAKLVAHQEDLELMAGLLADEGSVADDHPEVAELAKQVAALEKTIASSASKRVVAAEVLVPKPVVATVGATSSQN